MIPVRAIPDPDWIACTRCNGEGEVENRKECPECKGEGLINREDDTE